MSITIERVGPTLAGRVSGVDLHAPLDAGQVAALEAGMDEHAVLVIPAQDISDAQQMAFARHFGELENTAGAT